MALMTTRTIASAAEYALSVTYIWGHTGSAPAADRRFLITNFLTKNSAGVHTIPDAGLDEKLQLRGANSYISFTSADGVTRRGYLANFAGNTYIWNDAGTGVVVFGLNGAEAARFDVSGNFMIGTVAALANSKLSVQQAGAAGVPALSIAHTAASGTRYFAAFYKVGGIEVGNITTNGTTTTYSTSSDYRLKDNIEDLTGSGEFIDALRPRRGIWKSDGSEFIGFIAHEFAEVSPTSVQGEKDGIRLRPVLDPETGAPIIDEVTELPVMVEEPAFQSMQASSPEVMAHLILEVQSLRARTAQLEERLAALEG